MGPKYSCIAITLSLLNVVYSEDDTDLDNSAVEDWCNSFDAYRGVVHGNFCYTVHYEKLTWSAAEKDCKAEGGQLFKADDKKQIAAAFKDDILISIWTGAKEQDGGYYWLDGTPVEDVGSAFSEVIRKLQTWFQSRKFCLVASIGYPSKGDKSYSWSGRDCTDRYAYVCEHGIHKAFTAESTQGDDANITMTTETQRLAPKIPQRPSPKNVQMITISRIVKKHYLIQDDHLFERRAFAATMCSRLCLHPCQVFNYNTQTGQCRGFAITQANLSGVKKSAWEAWEIVQV